MGLEMNIRERREGDKGIKLINEKQNQDDVTQNERNDIPCHP